MILARMREKEQANQAQMLMYILKQDVKLEFEDHRCHKEGSETIGNRVVQGVQTDSCLVPQPEVAGEREVGE